MTYDDNVNAGTVTASAIYAASANYLASSDNKTFIIGKATLTLAITNSPTVYNGAAQAANIVANGPAGTVPGTPSNVLYNGSTTAPTNVGSYAVVADFTPGNTTNYESIVAATLDAFVINQASTTTTVTCTGGPFTYTGAPITPCTAAVTGPGVLNLAPAVTYANNTAAGLASASASFAGDANYIGSSDTKTFTIGKATPTLVVTNSPVIYDGAQHPAAIAVNGPGGTVPGTLSNIAYDLSPDAPTNAGTYAVTADFTPVDLANFSTRTDAFAGNLVIQPAATTTTITCTGGPFVYTGLALEPCTAVTTGPVQLNQTVPVVHTNNIDAGTASATASFAGSNNYASSSDAKTFIIAKALPTLTVTGAAPTYNGAAQAAVVVGSVGGTVGNIQYNGSATVPTNAGTYLVTADFAPANANYETLLSAPAGNFVINKADPLLAVTNSPVDFDGTAKTASVAASGPLGAVAGTASNLTYNGSGVAPTDAGTYAVNADFIPADSDELQQPHQCRGRRLRNSEGGGADAGGEQLAAGLQRRTAGGGRGGVRAGVGEQRPL